MVLDAKTFVTSIVDDLKKNGEITLSEKDLESRVETLSEIFSSLNGVTEKDILTEEKVKKMIDKTISNTKANLSSEEKTKQRQVLEDIFLRGKSAAEALGIDINSLNFIYREACRLFNNGQYGDALNFYRFLDLFVPSSKFSFGAAACCHMQKDYKKAIGWYHKCISMDKDAPLPYYHLADCYITIKDYLGAMVALRGFTKAAKNDKKYAKICKKAELMMEEAKRKHEGKQKAKK